MARDGTGRGSLAWGMSCPWIRFGTLAPEGLIREAAHPLGFGPASEVFREKTGLVLDGSADSPGLPGVVLYAVPGRAGMYWRAAPGGGGELGLVARTVPVDGVAAEWLAAAASPPAGSTEEWFPRLSPGGLLVATAVRLSCGLPRVSAILTAGRSGGERVATGNFLHAAFNAGDRAASAGFLLGLSDSAYTSLSGKRCSERFKVCGELELHQPTGTVEAGLSLGTRQPPFAVSGLPAPDISARLAVEKPLARESERRRLRLEVERRVGTRADGAPVDATDVSASITVSAGSLELEACASAGASGTSVQADAQWEPSGRAILLSLEGGVRDSGSGCLLSVQAGIHFARRDSGLWIEAGMEELGLTDRGRAGSVFLRAGWKTVSAAFPTRRPAGPRVPGGIPSGDGLPPLPAR